MGGVCELGEKLKQAREAKGLSLEEAARRARLSRAYLEALEGCRFEELPEPALTRAHLRRLAGILGLTPEALLALYPAPEKPPPPPAPKTRRRTPIPVLFLALLALVAGGFWLLRPKAKETARELPAKPAQTAAKPEPTPSPERVRLRVDTEPRGAKVYLDGYFLGAAPVELEVEAGRRLLRVEAEGYLPHEQPVDLNQDRALTLRLVPVPKKEPAEKPPPKTLTLRITERSWLRVTTPEGKRLYERTATPGTELSFELPVVVRTGNAGGIRVFLGEKDLGPMGKTGEVLTRRFEAR